ncbi:MAG: histidinol dehydrogenase [Saprospiraceae bacterium]|nr:histidinol dehydrogenase [Saprospiraceae bacterium]
MIKTIIYPKREDFKILCKRPEIDAELLMNGVTHIFQEVEKYGDEALLKFTDLYDNVKMDSPVFDTTGLYYDQIPIPAELKAAIQIASSNIEKFHLAQKSRDITVNIMPGITCEQKIEPIEKVGIYIPGGSAPLFSTVLMLAIPARLAGCSQIILCTPPDSSGNIHPAVLYAALLCGISEIRLAGGAQAIAALTLGTATIPAVNKIFGPGNQYVTAAKKMAQNYGVAIDIPAGPSEVLIFADQTSIPEFIAADLLAQAEHGGDSQVVLVSTNKNIIAETMICLAAQIEDIPRKKIAKQALDQSFALLMETESLAFDFINAYAPEHLIIAADSPGKYQKFITNAGSVFMGNYCPESAGDYASGTNHTLPTNGWARSYSGVNMDAFCKKITFQNITKEGINALGQTIITMAEAEQLQAHANAVKIRLTL